MAASKKRILVLDGLRGLAILLVLLFHGYSVWSAYYPYKRQFSEIILFKYGSLGVQLFFLISGFVILMSVEKTTNYWKFLKKRWIRLFPSMLICSLLVYLTANFFYERPFGIPELKSLLPGITFINNGILEMIFKTDFPVLELSFWSLYVEVKFYIIFGALYFMFNRKIALLGIFLLYLSACILQIFIFHNLIHESGLLKTYIGSFIHFGWFVAGALTYMYYQKPDKKTLLAIIFTVLCSLFYAYKFQDLTLLIYLIVVTLVFFAALFWEKFGAIFCTRFFTFIGFISYPLYLLHENMLIASIIKIHKYLPQIPYFLLPILSSIFIIAIAYIVAKYLEPILQKQLKKII